MICPAAPQRRMEGKEVVMLVVAVLFPFLGFDEAGVCGVVSLEAERAVVLYVVSAPAVYAVEVEGISAAAAFLP